MLKKKKVIQRSNAVERIETAMEEGNTRVSLTISLKFHHAAALDMFAQANGENMSGAAAIVFDRVFGFGDELKKGKVTGGRKIYEKVMMEMYGIKEFK